MFKIPLSSPRTEMKFDINPLERENRQENPASASTSFAIRLLTLSFGTSFFSFFPS